jgi:chromosomal replication initiator protein
LQAICHAVSSSRPGATCHYISCETFINHFIEAVESGALHQFRYRYRHVGVLVIDDIQFLAERERSQEEFFHTFNTLHQSQRQIILSADCSPSEIPSLEERLVSRFNSGLVALLDRPCLETRMAIVRKKAKLRCIEVPEDVVRLVAGRIDTNIRDLEGTLVKIDALSQTRTGEISIEDAREALGSDRERSVKIPAILEAAAEQFGVRVSDLQGKKRSKAVTYPRHVCMYLARQLTTQSLEDIGGYFGGRDHSTVLHASRAIGRQAEQDQELRQLLDEIALKVKNSVY